MRTEGIQWLKPTITHSEVMLKSSEDVIKVLAGGCSFIALFGSLFVIKTLALKFKLNVIDTNWATPTLWVILLNNKLCSQRT